ncbi:MAG: hypothetical protein ACREMK_08475 [Gemmatimonadota bacterium]
MVPAQEGLPEQHCIGTGRFIVTLENITGAVIATREIDFISALEDEAPIVEDPNFGDNFTDNVVHFDVTGGSGFTISPQVDPVPAGPAGSLFRFNAGRSTTTWNRVNDRGKLSVQYVWDDENPADRTFFMNTQANCTDPRCDVVRVHEYSTAGTFTARGEFITPSTNDDMESATTTVQVGQPAASVEVRPEQETLIRIAGTNPDTIRLSATVLDVSGDTLTDRPITWTSSDSGATVTPIGLNGLEADVTAVDGDFTITASVDGVSDSALLHYRFVFAIDFHPCVETIPDTIPVGIAGLLRLCESTSTSPDVESRWVYGDGASSDWLRGDASASHAYDTAGTYTIVLQMRETGDPTSVMDKGEFQIEVTPLGDPAAGYQAWFMADAVAGLSDGDPVSAWEDLGPNHQDATQTTASFRPIYQSNVAAGRPAIRFDGVDDRLASPSGMDWGLTNHFTVFAVVRLDPSPGTGGQDVIGSNALSNSLDLIARRNDANGNLLAYFSSPDGTRSSDLALSPGTWYVLTWRLHANSPKHLQIRANKAYRLNDAGYTGIGTGPWQAAIGGRENGSSPFNGDIAEVIFYTNSISDADMEATEDYLLEKYDVKESSAPPLPAPTQLTATAVDHDIIDLAWTDNATVELGLRVERRSGQAGPFDPVATLGADATNHSDQSLTAETEYCYRIVAFDAGGDSAPSNVACATTSQEPPDPGSGGEPAPGYVAWFKGDGITGLNDGDPVATWDDSGTNNQDANQSTSSMRPVYKTNIVGGKPGVRFDGVDDRLVSPSSSDVWGLTNHFTVFAVVRLDPNPGTGDHDVVGSSAFASTLDLIARRNDSNSNWLAYSSSPDGSRNSDLVLTRGTWYVLTWRLRANPPKHLQIRLNKVYRLNDTGYAGIGTAPWPAAIGARQNGGSPFKGEIAEIIFYTSSLGDADMEATEDYLLAKYGLGN